jgi:hypothetical protein
LIKSLINCKFTESLKAKRMGVIKEPKYIDFSTKSEPWTEQELKYFREIMQNIKTKSAKCKRKSLQVKSKALQST